MTQDGHASCQWSYINFTMVFEGLGAICRLGGYQRAKIVNKIFTLDNELKWLNSQSRSCCVEVSLQMGNLDGNSGSNIHVRRIKIGHTVCRNTHFWYCIVLWYGFQGTVKMWSKAGGGLRLEQEMTLTQHLEAEAVATNPSAMCQLKPIARCGDNLQSWISAQRAPPEPGWSVVIDLNVRASCIGW